MTQAISAQSDHLGGGIRFNKPTMLGVGTMVWLGSELMFFSGLFAAYFSIRANNVGPWPMGGIKLDVIQSGIFTVILVLSSFTMQKAVYDLEHDRRRSARIWIVITMIMGAAFLANQFYEWTHASFSVSTNAFGSMFFIMTGLHGLHVFLGLVAMAFLLIRVGGRSKDPGLLPVMQSISYYWHFVDIVWIALYASLFLVH
ncbi:MAG: heme-copper oxidase subunit III [Actinobacteria bacterium]|jgi:cytochrome c oxidase subunit 3|nr:heme-copper oxidase subunit III [Actinomycetota bacterium]